jgi:6-phosphogluconolactonase
MYVPDVLRCHDSDDLARQAADLFVHAVGEAVRGRGRCFVALSGGSTPEKMYAVLARPEWARRVAWGRTLLFFGDERLVPHDDPRSNYGLARRALLAPAAVPDANVFPIPTDRSADECAAAYAATLAKLFGATPDGPPPRFDLVLLGLGDDGHTASLFPGAPALDVTDAWVTASPPGALPPPVERVTLTYPVLNAARSVVFLVAGPNKAEALRDVLEGAASPQRRPAAGVRPAEGSVTWLVDAAATAGLTRT